MTTAIGKQIARQHVPAFKLSSNNIRAIAIGYIAFTSVYYLALSLLFLTRKYYPSLSPFVFVAMTAVAICFAGTRYDLITRQATILLRGVALVCGAYCLLTFPDLPIITHNFDGFARPILIAFWITGCLAAVLAIWRPSFALIPPLYIFWIKGAATYVTGVPFDSWLDAFPLIDVGLFAAIAFLVLAVMSTKAVTESKISFVSAASAYFRDNRTLLVNVMLIGAIAIQMANYFYSSVAKMSLEGGPLYWLKHDNLTNIFIISYLNKQLIWQELLARWVPSIVSTLEHTTRFACLFIVFFQALGILAFLVKRISLLTFVFLDLMHLGIWILVGANFVSWFALNLVIILTLEQLDRDFFNWRTALVGACFALLAPLTSNTARLGWYDSLANNVTYFQVVDDRGVATRVPATFFGFYSYQVASMSFGLPPGAYYPTETNGRTTRLPVLLKTLNNCAFTDREMTSLVEDDWDGAAIQRFIQGFHARALKNADSSGHPRQNWFMLHHFYAAPSVTAAFSQVDLRRVRSYILRIEPTCASEINGRIVSHGWAANGVSFAVRTP